ncbi:GNAT family N-acetyltransferase [Actinoplanes teichomyceticus]|uniref:CelD/BcsL family acetyltransferase involved in cellulose biosynthesis n=1 Tax=Actinoplanes teichomyceticus TaxID=1867 RepID=A0A561VL85_ACTTI|nr:GNAT family N-acetyltransferase [Actinoplanes teichomyceticus]TWG12383.1 CelD/BcsL family acetyltransferase involved in cellulose biosynthesis [Actinoplanes teichomyceticus]GIF13743.1 acetyltransferase [Actinoplanes teichomyceticus]
MKISVVRPDELGPGELAAWRQFQQGQPQLQNPFLAPEFTLAVARHRPAARVAVLQDTGGLAGFFPYEVRNRVIGVPIGAGITDCQGLIHRDGLDWDPLALLKACRLPVWEFDHLMAGQRPFARFHTERAGSPLIRLTEGYPAYVENRNRAGDVVKQTMRKQRKMVREVGAERFVFDDDDPAALSALRAWKGAQYRRTQQYDRFTTGWIEGVLDELLAAPSPDCRAIVSTVYAGDRPVAAHLGLRSRSVLAYWFPSYDVDLSRYSAGILLCLRMAEAGAADGIRQIDLGKSEALYKTRLMNDETPVAAGRVGRSWAVTSARRTQSALTRSIKQGALGEKLKSGRTGRVLRGLKARLAAR